MPFSMLGQSSKLATTGIVRPSSAAHMGTKIGARGIHDAPVRSRLSSRTACLASQPNSLHPQRVYTSAKARSSRSTFVPWGPAHIQARGRSTIAELFRGNEEYMAAMSKDNPGLLASLAKEGQRPPFMLVDCSDSRVNEQGIFSAQPGTIFTAGNIANRFDEDDLNSNAVLSFAVETLKVKHVVVLGHYGCGGVAASMIPQKETPTRPADIAVQGWISPIRHIYETSTRGEIVAHREKYKSDAQIPTPDLHDPAFRALVEENVKSNVHKIANSAVMRDLFAAASRILAQETSPSPTSTSSTELATPPEGCPEIYIHGWVYDVENGKVSDLGVSVGPPGLALPFSPFPMVGAGRTCKNHGCA